MYVPKDEALRVEIIRLHHNMPIGGHREQWKMVEMVARSNEGGEEIHRRVQCLPA